MRTKKLLYMGCLMAASLLTFSSCGDFLDEEPKGQLTPNNFFNSEDDLTASVNALYDRINRPRAGPTLCTHSGRAMILQLTLVLTSRLVLRSMLCI